MRNQIKQLSLFLCVSFILYGVVSNSLNGVIVNNFHAFIEWAKHPEFRMPVILEPVVKPEFFIDVWKLRDDVAALEAMQATDDTDGCYQEGDTGEESPDLPPPSPQELARLEEAEMQRVEGEKACVADVEKRSKAYTLGLETFNRRWMPVLAKAIDSKDPVAEVIMRQCSTSTVLDRSNIESTCDKSPERRVVAAKRLKEIGFAPAYDWQFEAVNRPMELELKGRLENKVITYDEYKKALKRSRQELALEQFGQGVFGAYDSDLVDSSLWLSQHDQVVAMLQIAPRAFTFSMGKYVWETEALRTLKLVRNEPFTPERLTWGPALISNGDQLPVMNGGTWRGRGISIELPRENSGYLIYATVQRVAEVQANIDRVLQQDPRWAAFLLQRVGHHEWIPEGRHSISHRLTPNWVGEWELEKTFENWDEQSDQDLDPLEKQKRMPHSATIVGDGEFSRITFNTNSKLPPLEDASCVLRYSGGATFGSQTSQEKTNDILKHTLLGDLSKMCRSQRDGWCTNFDKYYAAVAPLNLDKSYKQVLVQCNEGDSTDGDKIRFVLLEEDSLVEFAAAGPFAQDMHIRHYRRKRSKTSESAAQK